MLQQKQDQVIESETDRWDKEYLEYQKAAQLIGDLADLEKAYFEYGGETRPTNMHGNLRWQIDKDVLAYSVSSNLVDYDKDDATIELTEKGKYFLAKQKLNA